MDTQTQSPLALVVGRDVESIAIVELGESLLLIEEGLILIWIILPS